jgi:hypothetical protein
MRHRGRHGLKPWLVLATLPGLAELGHVLTIAPAVSAAAALLAAFVIVLAWRKYWDAANRKKALLGFCYTAGCALMAAAWLCWAALAGVNHQTFRALLLAWLIPALIHWNRWRNRHAHGKKELPPELPAPAPDVLLKRLRERVTGPGGTVAGATVTEMEPITGGRRFQFGLVAGKQTISTVTSAKAPIASAAEVPIGLVITEPVPGTDGERGPEHLAMVTILDAHHPQKEIQEFTGPTFDPATGLFDVGPYPDGEMARARLLKVDEHGNPIRGASGLTAGAPGAGKSRYAEHKIMEHLASGLFQVVYFDGQGGASVPDLIDHVGWPALQHEEWGLCIRALGRLMAARIRLIGHKRMAHWGPELGPFVHIPFEEAQKLLLDPVILRVTKHLLQEGEKVGIGLDLSTQFPSQVELGAASGTTGANVLRDLAASGNVTLFRTGSEFAKTVTVGNIAVSPRDLPRIPGMCHPLGVSMREAPVRAIRSAAPASWAHEFRPMPFTKFDIAAMDGGEGVYSRRMERIAAQLSDPSDGALDMAGLDAEVAMMLGETLPGQKPHAPGKATCVQWVWQVICDRGPIRRRDIIDALDGDWGESSVDKALQALEAKGGIQKAGPGKQDPWERRQSLVAVSSAG